MNNYSACRRKWSADWTALSEASNEESSQVPCHVCSDKGEMGNLCTASSSSISQFSHSQLGFLIFSWWYANDAATDSHFVSKWTSLLLLRPLWGESFTVSPATTFPLSFRCFLSATLLLLVVSEEGKHVGRKDITLIWFVSFLRLQLISKYAVARHCYVVCPVVCKEHAWGINFSGTMFHMHDWWTWSTRCMTQSKQ